MNDPNKQGIGLRSMHPDVEHTNVRATQVVSVDSQVI